MTVAESLANGEDGDRADHAVAEAEEAVKPISCMAIFENCMVNGFADGKVMLYDMEAMQSASMKLPSMVLSNNSEQCCDAGRPGAVPIASLAACGAALPITATLVLDATSGWEALQKWTLEHFHEQYGDLTVSVTHVGGKRAECKLAEYIENFPEVRLDEAQALSAKPGQTPYLRGWFFEAQAPELLQDFTVPTLFQDWFERLPKAWRPPFHWIFLGPRGSCTPMHIDPTLTHAWLAQIQGRKRFLLFPPNAVCTVHDAATGTFVDPYHPDMEKYPNFSMSRGLEVVLEPGDFLYIPPNWAHHVTCIDDSLSLTFNFLPKEHFSAVRTLFLMKKVAKVQRERTDESGDPASAAE